MEKRKYRRMTTSVKCMVFCEGDLLLLQKKDKEGMGPWEFPGGGLEFGENFKDAALREVREEAGLDIDVLGVAGLWSYCRTESVFLTGLIFVAETAKRDVTLSEEHMDYVWIKPEELHRYKLQDSLRKALEQIAETEDRGRSLCEYFKERYKQSV